MPLQQDMWKIGKQPERLSRGRLDSERQLEEMIVAEPDILSSDWMLIGRQEQTPYSGVIDNIGCRAGRIADYHRAQA